ncbi:magnesium transporter [Spelaeicoccus albus]|uniref:Magnesium transporter MgtE n=1 Tax=Spelaeicoccus albus TaxID=1280376 RepID=A0A7Z0D234_9MICO|nr:magnesium transporter [Spelaeicoccus albus]NYI67454.1 magnesium transporter [Spelaeicoccus albus]
MNSEIGTPALPVFPDGCATVGEWLDATPDRIDRGEQLTSLTSADLARLFDELPVEDAGELVGTLWAGHAAAILTRLGTSRAAAVLDELAPDVVAAVLRHSGDELSNLRTGLSDAQRAAVDTILRWPDGTAGARMTPHVLTVLSTSSAMGARAHVRAAWKQAEIIVYVFVLDARDTLLGVVTFRDLMLAPSRMRISELMEAKLVTVEPDEDQEQAAQLLVNHRLAALPVVLDGKLLGIISADDVSDIIVAESTEDAERQGGSTPLEVPYLRASPLLLWRKRIVWLLALFVAEAYTGSVLRNFEAELDQVVALSFFIPLLIGTGGNTGTQITTTIVRALAVGEVRMRDMGRILGKEISAAGLIAIAMAVAAWIRAWTLGVGPEVGVVVTVTIAAIVVWSAVIATVLPPILRKIRLDPAVVSAPMIATVVDGTGLVIYFEVARLVLF